MQKEKVVECVPNFSEGRNEATIQAIASSIRDTDGCSLLSVDPGVSTNRTVYTFFGSPSRVVQGALMAAMCAHRLIDMTKHSGEHPRIGALDVCPFIPVTNVTMEECVECSRQFGEQLSKELDVPVYLYEESQEKEFRKKLSVIRKGEYEGLKNKLLDPKWAPDFGPANFVPEWGASVTGARKLLIAFNVNLLGTKQQAHRIALDLREIGRGPEELGLFKEVKGIGWYLDENNLAQVSMNLCDYNVTSMHMVYEECCRIAKSLNLAVVGSEIVGLVPLAPILMAAEYYMEKEGLFLLQEDQKIRLVMERLGLHSISEFKPKEKIIEYCIGSNKDGPFLSGSLRSFVEELGNRTSTPGGGSAAACIASMGAALGMMVGLLTFGKREFEALDSTMRATIKPLYIAMQQMLPMVDRDVEAFTDYMAALKLPRRNAEERERRKESLQLGIEKAIEVPLNLMRLASSCWPHLAVIAEHGNIRAISDIQVAAHSLDTGIRGAYYNVSINLKQVKDEEYATKIRDEVETLLQDSSTNLDRVLEIAKNRE